MDHRDPGNTGYAGALAAIITGYMALLGLFLACGSSAPARTEREGSTAVLVVGTLTVPSVQGHGLPQPQELWTSVQLLSRVRLFVTPWAAARQASLSIVNCWSLLKLMSIESVTPSSHLILCRPLLLLPSIFPSIRVFSKESVLCITWPECWSFSFSTSAANEYSGLISFRMDWLDLPGVQGTLRVFF